MNPHLFDVGYKDITSVQTFWFDFVVRPALIQLI